MVRKVLKKLTASMRTKSSKELPHKPKKTTSPRILTAEGWRRLMQKGRS